MLGRDFQGAMIAKCAGADDDWRQCPLGLDLPTPDPAHRLRPFVMGHHQVAGPQIFHRHLAVRRQNTGARNEARNRTEVDHADIAVAKPV